MTFGQCFNNIRRENKQTLRKFCKENDFDVMIISGIERDLIPPLKDRQLIEAYRKALNIEVYSIEYMEFFRLACECVKYFEEIPQSSEFYEELYEMRYYENKYNESAKKVVHIKEQLEMIKHEK